jgi:hypothetical protein
MYLLMPEKVVQEEVFRPVAAKIIKDNHRPDCIKRNLSASLSILHRHEPLFA